MKVFVAGASGALGVQLVPELVAAGHEVVAMTRTASKQDGLRALGARPVVADALDPDAVASVVGEAEPEVIVHQLTALSGTMRRGTCGTPSASSRRPTGCVPRRRTISWPPAAPWGHGASWRRASRACGSPARAGRC